jgi:hypothetical protein
MGAVLLVSEARGEFSMVQGIRAELDRLGVRSVHVTAHSSDVSADELVEAGAVALDRHPAFAEAFGTAADELAGRVRAGETELDANLRRVWQADLRSWREGESDDHMARFALGYLAAWRQILADSGRIDVVWGEDGGHLAKRIVFLLAERRGIPLSFLYVSPLPGRMLHLDNALNRFAREELAEVAPTPEERAYAERLLEDVRQSRVQFATPRDLSFRTSRFRRLGQMVVERYVTRPPGAASHYPWRFARQYARQRSMQAVLRATYRPLGKRPFVFHPIHAGFDAQITIRAPQWWDQLALVEHIAASLPYGYELAVKEHPFEVGALPPARLLGLLRRRPEIRLLQPTIHAHEILRACSAVTTVNSTTGFEALFFGRPLVTFGHGPYRGLGLTHDIESTFDTAAVLGRAVGGAAAPEEEVIRLIAFLHRRSFEAISVSYDADAENLRRYAEFFAARAAERE